MYAETYDKIENAVDSYYEYAEAFFRSLLYTGLFTVSGRSIATKIRRAEHSLTKVTMLREQFRFAQPDFHDIDTYMEWFGDPDACASAVGKSERAQNSDCAESRNAGGEDQSGAGECHILAATVSL